MKSIALLIALVTDCIAQMSHSLILLLVSLRVQLRAMWRDSNARRPLDEIVIESRFSKTQAWLMPPTTRRHDLLVGGCLRIMRFSATIVHAFPLGIRRYVAFSESTIDA